MRRRLLAAIAVVLAVGAALSGTTRRNVTGQIDISALASDIEHENDHVTAMELAEWIKDRKPGLRVIDVRSDSEYQDFHIASAERIPLSGLSALKPVANETLVLYSEGGAHAAQGWILLRAAGHRNVFFLRGGILDWMDEIMSPSIPEKAATAAADSVNAHRAALSRYFGGVPHVGDPAKTADDAVAAVKRVKRRGC